MNPPAPHDTLRWVFTDDGLDWEELSRLYKLAPLGDKAPGDLQVAFGNSLYKCLVYSGGTLVAAGRALADGRDCACICDVAVLPDWQGAGLGKDIVARLVALSAGHRKILLYAVPGREPFYRQLGFRRMKTAMALFENQPLAAERGYIEDDEGASGVSGSSSKASS